MRYKILPSLLAADIMHLGTESDLVIKAGADFLHLDIMDNHYVPNLTYGPALCQQLNNYIKNLIPIDVHLMVTPVDELIEKFAKAGANRITIHPDATIHLDRSLQLIRQHHCKVGLALNPADSIEVLNWIKHRIDFVLIMTVNPGFGGQHLISEVIEKISEVREKFPTLSICVDGGINIDNIASLAKAGASEFVIGTALFHTKNYSHTMQQFRQQLVNE